MEGVSKFGKYLKIINKFNIIWREVKGIFKNEPVM